MKLSRILLETIIKRLQPLLDRKASELNVAKENLASAIENISENPNVQQWLLSNFTADDVHKVTEIKDAIAGFERDKERLANKNLAGYSIDELLQLFRIDDDVLHEYPSAVFRVSDPLAMEGVEVFHKSGPMIAYIVEDAESLMDLGEGSKWCTRGSYHNCQAQTYLDDHGPQIIVVYNGRLIAQFSADLEEIKNQENDDITLNDLFAMGLSREKMYGLVAYMKPDGLSKFIRKHLGDTTGRIKAIEDAILGGSKESLGKLVVPYCKAVKERWPEGERALLGSGLIHTIFEYAADVIRGEWPEAEGILLKHPGYAFEYAQVAIRRRWPEAESLADYDGEEVSYHMLGSLISYGERFRRGERWPEAERVLIHNPAYALRFARLVLRQRWPEVENVDFGDNVNSKLVAEIYDYSYNFLRNIGWPNGEKVLRRDPLYATRYILNVLNRGYSPEDRGRHWLEGEKAMLQYFSENNMFTRDTQLQIPFFLYIKSFYEGVGLPEAEPIFLKSPIFAGRYAVEVLGRRWPEGEKVIKNNVSMARQYAQSFPEAWEEWRNETVKEIKSLKTKRNMMVFDPELDD
jgi:hypothetical protein